jgi:hypothetical protein
MDRPSHKINGSLSFSQPSGPPCRASALAFGLLGQQEQVYTPHLIQHMNLKIIVKIGGLLTIWDRCTIFLWKIKEIFTNILKHTGIDWPA